MIYISHLFPDDQMEELIRQSGMGVESIDFSIADKLDHVSQCIDVYRVKLQKLGTEMPIQVLDGEICLISRFWKTFPLQKNGHGLLNV